MAPPFGPLKYLYVGSKDVEKDLAYHRDRLGGTVVWDIQDSSAHVAAIRLGDGPLVLLADHRPPGSVIYMYEVGNLKETMRTLTARGWKSDGPAFELPEGPCATFKDPSGNEFGIMQFTRPDVLGHEKRDPAAESGRFHGTSRSK